MLEATVSLPSWVRDSVDFSAHYASDTEKMQLAVRLARENVERGSGGPFGAAIFERDTGLLVSVGVNSVVRLNNCTLHAEMVAYQLAQKRITSYTLAADGHPAHELFTSCEPCAMCLGATLWSGVQRVVIAASRDDAIAIGFDEGPVFAESFAYLRERGVEIVEGVLRAEGREVLERYKALGGPVYNG
jgi:tRNA(Arg) A34 adenosine deaminase TadA